MSSTVNLVTATMGAGKTLFCVQLIDELLKKKKDEYGDLLPTFQVFTNIDGLIIDKFETHENLHLFSLPQDSENNEVFDWRDCPQGSIVIYDEAQFFFPRHMLEQGGARNQTPKILLDMTMARHMGIELWLITQDASQLHIQIRNVVGEHKHLYRAANAQISTIYTWHHYCESPNSRSEQIRAEAQIWSFPKNYYQYYKSAQIHTRKFVMPTKLKLLLFFIVITFSLSIYALIKDGGFNLAKTTKTASQELVQQEHIQASISAQQTITKADETEKEQGLESPAVSAQLRDTAAHQAIAESSKPSAYSWSKNAEEAVPISGCVYSLKKRFCQCFSERGVTLDLEPAACISAATSKPYPRNLKISVGSGVGAGSSAIVEPAKPIKTDSLLVPSN